MTHRRLLLTATLASLTACSKSAAPSALPTATTLPAAAQVVAVRGLCALRVPQRTRRDRRLRHRRGARRGRAGWPAGEVRQHGTDLKALRVAVQTGPTGDEAVTQRLGKTNGKLRRFESTSLALAGLQSGGVDAVVADNGVVAHCLAQLNRGLAVIRADGTLARIQARYFGPADGKP